MIPLGEAPRIGKFIETESRIEVAKVTRSWGKGEWRVTFIGTEFLFGTMKKFWKWIMLIIIQL